MKNTELLIMAVIGIVLVGGLIYFFSPSAQIETPENVNSGEVQKITLSFKDANYYPQTVEVKEGLPVEITLDNSVQGCYRTFVIKDFGVQKFSRNPEDTITFTPMKKGTFIFACGMGMGTGTLVVE